MRATDQLRLTKLAGLEDLPEPVGPLSGAAIATGTAGALPYLPWSTGRALYEDVKGRGHKDDVAQALMTDGGRAVGAGLGGMTAKNLAAHWGTEGSPLLRTAIWLGGTGIGATLGHMKGRNVGQELFPGSLRDRLQRAVNNF